MKELLHDFFGMYLRAEDNYKNMIATYNFTNDIPKYKMFVKLNDSISDDRREFIADGIRSYFRDDRTILLDLKVAMKAVDSSLMLFQIFVGIVGVIALTLAFFLLLISTTQNVRENVWEYGCLRAMGYTKVQGMKSFMFEQYSVVLSSLFIGTIVGFVVASVVTAQFFLFMEFPFSLDFPIELVYAMYFLAIVTTFYAVYVPVTEVNNKRISQTLKGLDI